MPSFPLNCLLGLLFPLSLAAVPCLAQQRPNVIFVLADDQGYGDMACYGNEFLNTPHMDRLFEESARLTNFYVSPVCAPSRASILTGRYNQRTGVWDTYRGRCNLHPDEYTLAEALSDAGYATGHFGKWHLGRNTPSLPEDQGFTTVVRDMYKPKRGRMNPVLNIDGIEKQRRGFLTNILFDEAMNWMKQCKEDGKPFFAYVCPRLVHTSAHPQVPEEYSRRFHRMDALEAHTAEVYGMAELLDENLGRLLDHVQALGIEEDTIFIYTSDNGAQMHGGNWLDSKQFRFNRGLRGAKGSVYEGGILVPFFIRWPEKLAPGRDIPGLTAHLDLLPTILELCGIKTELPNPIDGISLAKALRDEGLVPERRLFSQFQREEVPKLWKNTMIRKSQYKLVNGNQLYDLAKDPSEKNNIANSNGAIVQELKAEAEDLFQDISSTRGFSPTPTDFGHTNKKPVTLSPISDMTSKGFCLRILDRSPFTVTLEQVQENLFPEGTDLVLRFGDSSFQQPINPSSSEVLFSGIALPAGTYFMKVESDRQKVLKPWHFGLDDPGFRSVVLSRD